LVILPIKSQSLNGKIKVGAVSYLNTKPMVHLFEEGHLSDSFEFMFDYPSKVAQKLVDNEIDLGLVPVAVIPQIQNPHIVSPFCIATDGEVASVCLFSDVPLDHIETILLDYQSRSSVGLLKILLKHHWKINPKLINADSGYENQISNTTAGLVIGDRALIKRNSSAYVFDLGLAWKEMTGLPFVFAVWLANKAQDESKMKLFNDAIEKGLSMIPKVVARMDFKHYELNHYYHQNINYVLDEKKREAIDKYLSYLKEA
jgi:chorismate dehydratase